MDVIFETINDLLDAVIPSGATHSTEWYTLNEVISYMVSVGFILSVFTAILWTMWWYPLKTLFKRKG